MRRIVVYSALTLRDGWTISGVFTRKDYVIGSYNTSMGALGDAGPARSGEDLFYRSFLLMRGCDEKRLTRSR